MLEHANTRYAQGGIAGVMFDDDRIADHIADTLRAGAGLADPEAVRVLVDEGPVRIRELIALGVAFDRGADGEFVKGLEAAHSYPRILHAGGDATGTAIEKALVARLRASGARVIEHAFLVDLVREGGRVTGVDLFVEDRDRHRVIEAPTPSCSPPAAPGSSTPTPRTPSWRPATASPRRCAPARPSPSSSSCSSTRRCSRPARRSSCPRPSAARARP